MQGKKRSLKSVALAVTTQKRGTWQTVKKQWSEQIQSTTKISEETKTWGNEKIKKQKQEEMKTRRNENKKKWKHEEMKNPKGSPKGFLLFSWIFVLQ